MATEHIGSVTVTGVSDGRKSVTVLVEVEALNETYEAAGTAWKVPEDEFSTELGLKLAEGRALRDVGRKLIRDAMKASGQ